MIEFFDSIDIETLIIEAEAVGFPIHELAYTLTVHLAPRRLKWGAAHGGIIAQLHNSLIGATMHEVHAEVSPRERGVDARSFARHNCIDRGC